MSGSVQIAGQDVESVEVKDVTDSLQNDQIRLLSLRESRISDRDFKRLMKAIGSCKSISQLSLNVDILIDKHRVALLAQMLQKNRSLVSLFIHGNPLGDDGMEVISKALSCHPYITSLDVGDCSLTDRSVQFISDLLPPHASKPGLHDLTLSANPGITMRGWAQLSIAIAANSSLRSLYLDYNTLGDYCGSLIVVALSARREIEELDMEGCGITEHTAQLLLHLVRNFPVKLKKLVLEENKISLKTVEALQNCLGEAKDLEAATGSDESDEDKKSKTKLKRPESATKPIEVKVRPVKPQILHGESRENNMIENTDDVTEQKNGEFEQEDPSTSVDTNINGQDPESPRGRESPTEKTVEPGTEDAKDDETKTLDEKQNDHDSRLGNNTAHTETKFDRESDDNFFDNAGKIEVENEEKAKDILENRDNEVDDMEEELTQVPV